MSNVELFDPGEFHEDDRRPELCDDATIEAMDAALMSVAFNGLKAALTRQSDRGPEILIERRGPHIPENRGDPYFTGLFTQVRRSGPVDLHKRNLSERDAHLQQFRRHPFGRSVFRHIAS
ncbi:MAG TPA: hypothetical protein VK712_03735 [Verrucomicrobiae bacterium]|jgi:hypothetical protein|nr:hypothetical protein [Verrucomicrobiae bacterium]